MEVDEDKVGFVTGAVGDDMVAPDFFGQGEFGLGIHGAGHGLCYLYFRIVISFYEMVISHYGTKYYTTRHHKWN